MATCIFCSIIAGIVPAVKIAENNNLIVIKDIAPKASIHYLIIPKQHVADVQSFKPTDKDLAGDMLMMAQQLSLSLEGHKDFRLIVNSGARAGQQVFHLHMHFLAGSSIPHF